MEGPIIGIALVCALAFFVQGATAFGAGLTLMGILPLLIDAKDAAVLVTLVGPFPTAVMLWQLRKHVQWRTAFSILGGSLLVGVPLGVWIFVVVDTSALKILIGATLVIFCTYLLIAKKPPQIRGSIPRSVGVGIVGGTLVGATNTGGPPVVLYLYMQNISKEATAATIQVVFLIGTLWKVGLLAWQEQILGLHLMWTPFSVIGAFVGWIIGYGLFRTLHPDRLRTVVYLFLIGIGIFLVASGALTEPEATARIGGHGD